MYVHVDADQVDQGARAHRPAHALRHRLVHLFGEDAGFVEYAHAVVQQGNEDAVDDEARRVVATHRLLTGLLGPRVGRIDRLVRALASTDDLDQRQHRGGIEEVHTDDALRPLRRFGDLGDGQRGRVRRQDRVGTSNAIELGEQLTLELEL